MTEHPIVTLWKATAEQEYPPIIELLDKNKKPVGAVYLDKFRYKTFAISETNSSEKYYLYVDGLGIYFSYHQKIGT